LKYYAGKGWRSVGLIVRNEVLQSQRREEYRTYNKKRHANWVGHILRRNGLIKHVIEGKIEMTGR
jgi:hypothetical protein